jgi:hypothetical protein
VKRSTLIRHLTAALAVAGAALWLAPGAADAKKPRAMAWGQYVVPFTCGTNAADTTRVVPGLYAAAVDVHNPEAADVTVVEKVALSFPPGGHVEGDVSAPVQATIAAGSAVQLDCAALLAFDFPGGAPGSTYVQGFLVLDASGPLGVSRTQTASGATGEVSVHVDLVEPRSTSHKVLVCHHGDGAPHTISIAAPAVRAHQAHGDSIGTCP